MISKPDIFLTFLSFFLLVLFVCLFVCFSSPISFAFPTFFLFLKWPHNMHYHPVQCFCMTFSITGHTLVAPLLCTHVCQFQEGFIYRGERERERDRQTQDTTTTKQSITTSHLLEMLDRTKMCPHTGKQKLKVYRAGICRRLSWLRTIEDLPISWVEIKLDAITTVYIKKWVGLAKDQRTVLCYRRWGNSISP